MVNKLLGLRSDAKGQGTGRPERLRQPTGCSQERPEEGVQAGRKKMVVGFMATGETG